MLSQPGKLLLINSILVSLMAHIMSTYAIPKSILNKINSFLRFFWASSLDKKLIYWRKTESLWQHKSKGGVILRNVEALNSMLLLSTAWRIHSKHDLLISNYTEQSIKAPSCSTLLVLNFPQTLAGSKECVRIEEGIASHRRRWSQHFH